MMLPNIDMIEFSNNQISVPEINNGGSEFLESNMYIAL